MKFIAIILASLFINVPAFAEQKLFYREYKEKSGEAVDETSFYIGDPVDGKIVVQWKSQKTGDTSEYIMDANYAIQSWRVVSKKNDTDYIGKRSGKQLIVKGRNYGKEIDDKIKINDKPFFLYPAFGLSEFVRSGQKSLEFWALRPDKLKGYKMKAKRQDEEVITLSGVEVKAIKVKWGLTGLLSRLFSQTSWYRKSDGLFVKSGVFRGKFMELANEQ